MKHTHSTDHCITVDTDNIIQCSICSGLFLGSSADIATEEEAIGSVTCYRCN